VPGRCEAESAGLEARLSSAKMADATLFRQAVRRETGEG
jgi:hypothetical protein